MNWNRILNVFIIVFFSVNVLLFGYQFHYNSNRYTLPDERVEQLTKTLNNNGISVYEYSPKYYPKPQLLLTEPDYNKDLMISNIIGEDINIQIDTLTLGERIYNDSESLTFYVGDQEGFVYYKSTGANYVPNNMTNNSIEDVAYEFAKDLFGKDVEMNITLKREVNENTEANSVAYGDEGLLIELNEVFGPDEDIVFQSFIRLVITREGITEALAIRYEPVEYIGVSENIYPFDEATYSLLYYLLDEAEDIKSSEGDNKIIRHIDVGYYFADINSAKSTFQLDPHYRIVFQDGDTYYINAYTNAVIEP